MLNVEQVISTKLRKAHEINRALDGYDYKYWVTNTGKIYSEIDNKFTKHPKRELKATLTCGYPVVQLRRNGTRYTVGVHRLVALVFIPNPHNKPHINHIDGNKQNHSIENLEWCTPQENNHHARRTGLIDTRGEKCGTSKLGSPQVLAMREVYEHTKNVAVVAQAFGEPYMRTYKAVKKLRWAHL